MAAPIFVSDTIPLVAIRSAEEAQKEQFKTYLENLKPSDFMSDATGGTPDPQAG